MDQGTPDEGPNVDLASILCWLLKDILSTRLQQIFELADYQAGAPMAERPALLAQLEAKLWDLEIEEEQLIMQAAVLGTDVRRRDDCRPEVVLHLPATAQAAAVG